MKKLFVLLLVASLVIASSNMRAQTNISIGAKAGLNMANATFDPDLPGSVTKSSRTGFQFGGALAVGFAPMFALQVEPMFQSGGSEISGPGGKITFKTSFIEVPILFKVNIPVPGSVTPYAFVGPNIAFVMSSKQLAEITGFASNETDIKDQTSSINFSLDIGAGAGFKVAPLTTVTLDVRYSLGLANLLNDQGKQSTGYNSIKSTGFQILAGVMFGLN